MNNGAAFPLALEFEGRHYRGKVTPSEEKGDKGTPVYFRVTLDGQFFAYICCADHGWIERDGKSKPPELVGAIGDYIRRFYE
jgi:hypothetical protein